MTLQVKVKLVVQAEVRGPMSEFSAALQALYVKGFHVTRSGPEGSGSSQYLIVAERPATDKDLYLPQMEVL